MRQDPEHSDIQGTYVFDPDHSVQDVGGAICGVTCEEFQNMMIAGGRHRTLAHAEEGAE